MTARSAEIAARTGLVLEVVVVGLLIVPETGAVGPALAAGVLGIYTAALAVGMANGRRVACRCFGNDGEMMGLLHLLRNGMLTLAAGAGVLVGTDAELPASSRDAVMIGAGLVAGWLCTRWDDMGFLLSAAFRDPLPGARASR
jgi:Methylamine utilisation protein MauE